MPKKKRAGASISKGWVDPDDAPEFTDDYFERADVYLGDELIRRGRPKLEARNRRSNCASTRTCSATSARPAPAGRRASTPRWRGGRVAVHAHVRCADAFAVIAGHSASLRALMPVFPG